MNFGPYIYIVNYLYPSYNIDIMKVQTGGYGIAEFVQAKIDFDIESEVSKDELYQRYVEFCRENKNFRAERNVFFREFYRICKSKVKPILRSQHGKRVWKILGIRLK